MCTTEGLDARFRPSEHKSRHVSDSAVSAFNDKHNMNVKISKRHIAVMPTYHCICKFPILTHVLLLLQLH